MSHASSQRHTLCCSRCAGGCVRPCAFASACVRVCCRPCCFVEGDTMATFAGRSLASSTSRRAVQAKASGIPLPSKVRPTPPCAGRAAVRPAPVPHAPFVRHGLAGASAMNVASNGRIVQRSQRAWARLLQHASRCSLVYTGAWCQCHDSNCHVDALRFAASMQLRPLAR